MVLALQLLPTGVVVVVNLKSIHVNKLSYPRGLEDLNIYSPPFLIMILKISQMKTCFISVLLFFIISCYSPKKEIVKNNTVTIIVKNQKKIKTSIGSGINKNHNKINISSTKATDTITLKTSDYLKLYIKNDNSFTSVLCKKADTLLINVDSISTKSSFLNRQLKKYDSLPLINELYKANLKQHILAYNKVFKKFIKFDKTTNNLVPETNIIKSNLKDFRNLDSLTHKKFELKKEILNKIYKQDLISDVNYVHQVSLLNFKYFTSLIRSYKFSHDSYYIKKINTLYFNNRLAFNDPFISYGYLNSFIINIVLIDEKEKINIDYQKAYDNLDYHLKNKKLKLFKQFCLHQIAKSNNNFTNNYFEKYKKEYNDSSFIKSFTNRYLINEKKISTADKVDLIGSNSITTNLNDIIKKHKNKTLYIDFWASWCYPCRNEMPESKKLMKEFEGKNIEFIYISIDSDKNEWIKANKEDDLSQKNNFLAINYPSSIFYDELKLQTIPRYLIYSKGKLVDRNAPRPSSTQIRKTLDNYLK